MTKRKATIVTGKAQEWKIHTTRLLEEILINPQMAALVVPINIFQRVLAEVAERAIELDDDTLNRLMLRLTLYDQGDPYSKGYVKNAADQREKERFDKVDLDKTVIAALKSDEPDWKLLPQLGPEMRKAWATMPVRIRIAIVTDSLLQTA